MKKLLCLFGILLFAIGATQAQGNISGGSSPLTLIATTNVTPPTNTTTPDDGTNFGTVTAGSVSAVHDFVFTSTTASTLVISVELLGPDAAEFLDSAPVPSQTNGVDDTATFQVTFRPDAASNANDVKSAWVHVRSGQPPFGNPFEDYYFLIQGTVGAAAPSIEVFDNESLALANGGTDPFGNAVGGVETITRQYTIENNGTGPLAINDITNSFGDPQFTVVLPGGTTFPFDINPNSSFTFSVSFAPDQPDTPGLPDVNYFAFIVIDTETVDDATTFPTDPTDFFFQVTGTGIAPAPDMDVFGNGILITGDDTNIPNPGNDTDFGLRDISLGGIANTFTIENNGTADLVLTSLAPIVDITGLDAGDFSITIDPLITTIIPGGSTTFEVTFDPTTVGQKNATIEIANNGVDNPYTFDITGLGVDNTGGGGSNQLLITQYFEGDDGANRNSWIEVKNISLSATLQNAYHLALYEDLEGTLSGFISTSAPTVSEPIPPLNAGGVVLFRRNGATLSNLGPAPVVNTEVCRFDGNDIILISTSNGTNTYNDRIDIMGIVGDQTAITWGVDTALIKGCGTDEVPTAVYDPTNVAYNSNQYIVLTLAEVDAADPDTNIRLGTQTVGPTTWITSWNNNIPDKTKSAIVSGTYANSNGSFESCDLTVNAGATINFDSGGSGSNYILVENDLTVSTAGTFIIGDTEALVTVNPNGIMSGNIEKREVTTSLNNFRDFTYWSSPVNTTIEQAFAGVDPNRIFEWDAAANGMGDWAPASGSMTSSRGYISEAPSTTLGGGTHSVSFIGTPNNGTEGIQVVFNTSDDPFRALNFNLIGNPYPSAINIDDFIQSSSNNDMDGTIWLWTHITAIDTSGEFLGLDYATYNLTGGISAAPSGGSPPTGNIGSGQGFFVYAVSGGPVFFENSMRLKGQNTQFFRAPDAKSTVAQEKDRVWLNVESNTGGAFSQILVGFFDKATDGHDRGYDGTRLGASWIDFYSKIDTVHYAVQGLSSFDLDKRVSIGFDTYIPDAMTYKISIDNVEGALNDNDLYLVDNELNIVHDLKLASYEFDVNGEGIFPDRFTLQFNKSTLGVDDLELSNDFVVINEENTLRLKSNTVITDIKVYDILGRLLIDTEPNDSEFEINTQAIRKGTVLILNATFDNGAEVSKKAIKY